jgi:hypothetical protein
LLQRTILLHFEGFELFAELLPPKIGKRTKGVLFWELTPNVSDSVKSSKGAEFHSHFHVFRFRIPMKIAGQRNE